MNTRDVPQHIRVDREQGWFELEWSDGASRRITLDCLRDYCPCAQCGSLREESAHNDGLHMLAPDEVSSSELREIVPVGAYAIQIRWADGHDAGIYRYPYLRELLEAHGVSST